MDNTIITSPLVCEESTILSHCCIDNPIVTHIPKNWLFHTAAITIDGAVLYVTIAFSVTEDLKGDINQSPHWKTLHVQPGIACSIWQSRLFEARKTMGESFLATWNQVTAPFSTIYSSNSPRYSMQDIIKFKYLPSMISHRESLEGHKR